LLFRDWGEFAIGYVAQRLNPYQLIIRHPFCVSYIRLRNGFAGEHLICFSVPLFIPIVIANDVDLVWFGIVVVGWL